ncbi:MAG: hypothetical protein R3C05_15895 [Pirellulaceae bacterium]
MSWNLENTDVSYTSSPWTLQSDLALPERGWRAIDQAGLTVDRLLSVRCSSTLSPMQEAYCQQGDLIVRYPQTQANGVGLDIRYQITSVTANRLVLQGTIALQTRDFEAHPELCVSVGNVSSPELTPVSTWSENELHLAVVIDPIDVAQAKLVTEQNGERAILFFGEFMERGVIRKCRLRLILALNDRSLLETQRELEALSSEPLPLVS